MEKVLITGGAGFIGSHLARGLLQSGHDVAIIDDLSTGRHSNIKDLGGKSFKLYVASASDQPLIRELMREYGVVYHLASSVGVKLIMDQPTRTIENIFQTTETILRTARVFRNKVLITSTSEVYGKSTQIPFTEDGDRVEGPTDKHRWAYACAKALDEFLALGHWKESRLPVVIARLFNTVGPGQRGQYGMVFPNFVRRALRGEELIIHGDGSQSRCFCHVADVVAGLMAIMGPEKCHGQIYNIGSTAEVRILDLAEMIIERLHSTSKTRGIPYDEAYGGGFEDMQRRVPSIDKIRNAVGWEPQKHLEDIIDDVARWIEDNPEP